MAKREWNREREKRKDKMGEKDRQPEKKQRIKDVLSSSCVMLHATETEQQKPEANNATLVRLMLTTNDSV